MSLNISYFNTSYLKPVLSVGIASALTTLLANVSNMVIIMYRRVLKQIKV